MSWFEEASSNLNLIKENINQYEDEESITPSPDVLSAAESHIRFLNKLPIKIDNPRWFVSPNGHVVLNVNIEGNEYIFRFTPGMRFIT